MLPSKKVFFTSSSILLIVILFWGIYNFSFKKTSDPKDILPLENPFSEEKKEDKELLEKNKKTIQAITDEAAIAPILTKNDESLKYYSRSTGKVYETDLLNFNKTVLSENILIGLLDVFWSSDQNSVLSKFSNGSGYPRYSFFDYATKKSSALNENIGSVSWQNPKKIIYTFFDKKTKDKSINISDPDGKNWKKIISFTMDSVVIAPIPKSSFVSYWNKPDAYVETVLQSTPILGGETKTLSSGVFGADYLWSPDGTLFLRSHVNQKGGNKMELGFANNLGGEYKNIGLPTFVSKCTWSKNNTYIFCALPGAISEKSVLPNDYNNHLFTTSDTFWKINLDTGEKTRAIPLEELEETYDAEGLFLDSNESHLFFTNRIDGKIYRIKL